MSERRVIWMPRPPKPVCDFCYEGEAAWRCPAREIEVTLPGGKLPPGIEGILTGGDWAACEACHALLEADDRAGLAVRAAEILLGMPDAPPATLADLIACYQHMHAAYFRSRTGPVRREL